MADERFEVIRERLVGPAAPALEKRWAVLQTRKARLQKAHAKLEAAYAGLEKHLAALLPAKLRTPAHAGYKLREDHKLYQLLCGCAECQAVLHGLSLTDTIEAMARINKLSGAELEEARETAYDREMEIREEKALDAIYN